MPWLVQEQPKTQIKIVVPWSAGDDVLAGSMCRGYATRPERTPSMQDPTPRTDLSTAAQRHLWMHFTKLESFDQHEVPVITRGEGCYVYDQHGKRYLDGLSGLFTVQVGHGRSELAEAAREQAERLAYFPVWSFAHEPGIRLAERLAAQCREGCVALNGEILLNVDGESVLIR